MPVTITGGKYAVASVSSVGTTTVTVGTTPFVSGDFNVARRVDLYTPNPDGEKLTNGSFASDTAWTKGGGVTISGGVVNCTGAALIIAQVSGMTVGQEYACSYTYTKTAGANIRACNSLDGTASVVNTSALVGTSGTIEFLFTATSANFSLGADGGLFTGTIDNFSIRKISTVKGVAFVRKWNSTSQLELETEFFNPKTGAVVTQAVGDEVLISKSLADVIQAGISLSNGVYTISDTITFGRTGIPRSVALHDEEVTVVNTLSTSEVIAYSVAGGFVSFGHLQSYENKSWYGGAKFSFTSTNAVNSFIATNPAARFWMIGGAHKGAGGNPCYFSAGRSTSSVGTDWEHFWALDVQFDSTDIVSKSEGGSWTTGTNHVLENCSFVGTGTNLIMVRFGNGSILGGQFKFPRNTAAPIAVFGSDAAGTFNIGASAGDRSFILDVGQNVFWRSSGSVAQTINITNLISTDYRAGTGLTPESSSNGSATKNIYFRENYTNLQTGSALGTIRDSDFTLDDSATSAGATESVRVFHSTANGHAVGAQRGPWTYRIRKYGFNELEGAIAESAYSLGVAGTAFNVAFGGLVNQIARTSLADSEATAAAYTGIAVTDRGASPVTWNGKAYSIDIVVDLTVAPSRTAAQVFAHVKAKIAATATWGGKAGILWHVLMEESGSGYVTQRGKSGGAGASLKGVRVVDQAGNPLPGFVGMVADDGTTYTPPVSVTLTVSANVTLVGAEIRIYDLDSAGNHYGTELGGVETHDAATFAYSGAAGNVIGLQIMKPGYIEYNQTLTMPASSAGLSVTLTPETNA